MLLHGFMMLSLLFGQLSVVNPYQQYTYDQLTDDVHKLDNAYSDISLTSIGKSHFGRDIWALKLGKGKQNVLMIGSHHGREWLTTNLLMTMIDRYAMAYEKEENLYGYDMKILDDVSIWMVPMINPDGVTIQQQGLDNQPIAYRELLLEMNENSLDFKRWKANGVGIDLNRQYPAGWKDIQGDSSAPSYQYYKGEKPIEAKEVKAVIDFTYIIDPKIAVSYHSSGHILYWYYKNNPSVLRRDIKLAKKFSHLTGYKLAKPPKNATGGGFTDWFITEFHRPAFTPEISHHVKDTNPPLSVFYEEWLRNREAGLLMVKEAVKIK